MNAKPVLQRIHFGDTVRNNLYGVRRAEFDVDTSRYSIDGLVPELIEFYSTHFDIPVIRESDNKKDVIVQGGLDINRLREEIAFATSTNKPFQMFAIYPSSSNSIDSLIDPNEVKFRLDYIVGQGKSILGYVSTDSLGMDIHKYTIAIAEKIATRELIRELESWKGKDTKGKIIGRIKPIKNNFRQYLCGTVFDNFINDDVTFSTSPIFNSGGKIVTVSDEILELLEEVRCGIEKQVHKEKNQRLYDDIVKIHRYIHEKVKSARIKTTSEDEIESLEGLSRYFYSLVEQYGEEKLDFNFDYM